MLFIVDYDEHGGFFDHVIPPSIPTTPPSGARYVSPFTTLGVRVPGYLISPFVKSGFASQNLLDHTSVLKLLGEKFGNGHYSPEVDVAPACRQSVARLGLFCSTDQSPGSSSFEYISHRTASSSSGRNRAAGQHANAARFYGRVEFHEAAWRGRERHPKFGDLVAAIPS